MFSLKFVVTKVTENNCEQIVFDDLIWVLWHLDRTLKTASWTSKIIVQLCIQNAVKSSQNTQSSTMLHIVTNYWFMLCTY